MTGALGAFAFSSFSFFHFLVACAGTVAKLTPISNWKMDIVIGINLQRARARHSNS
jgi:hypothetical protein